MDKNDLLRRLRYALDISNSEMAAIFKLAGHNTNEAGILILLKREDEEGYIECTDKELELFLDGLIISRRGKRENSEDAPSVKTDLRMSNNNVLKKLRIAFDFKEDAMLEMFSLAEFEISKPELSAIFRKKGSRNYKVCGDQILKNFIKGLTLYLRK